MFESEHLTTSSSRSHFKTSSWVIIFTKELITATILITNVLTLIVFSKLRAIRISFYYHIALAVAEILIALVIGGLGLACFVIDRKHGMDSFCRTFGLMTYAPFQCSAIIQVLMSVDKRISVVKPITYRQFMMNRGRAKTVTLGAIAFVVIGTFIYDAMLGFSGLDITYYDENKQMCMLASTVPGYIAMIPFLLLPIGVQLLTLLLILLRMRKMNRFGKARTLKACKAVGLTVGVFYICWIPMTVVASISFSMYGTSDHIEAAIVVATFIIYSHGCWTLLIYIYSFTDFKKKFKVLFCRKSGRVFAIRNSS